MGNEFGAVEALWSQFEGVVVQEPEEIGAEEAENEGSEVGNGGGEDEDETENVAEKGKGH